MQKAEPLQANLRNQLAVRNGRSDAVVLAQSGETAQLAGVIESRPQTARLDGLAALMDAAPASVVNVAMAAQCRTMEMVANGRQPALRRTADMIRNSSHQQAVQKFFDDSNSSPTMIAQRKKMVSPFGVAQRVEDEGPLQGKSGPVLREENNTGLPDNLKNGMENLSGMSMDHVKVHYNSSKPAAVRAHAFAQGSDIHLASGQEKHLPHELGHVVQQAQGRVKATTSIGGVSVNDNPGLENEATGMGEMAMQMTEADKSIDSISIQADISTSKIHIENDAIQRKQMAVMVTGLTHLVEMVDGSIMSGKEVGEVSSGTSIAIDNEVRYRSRRGPNKEIYEDEDRGAEHNYRWFKVLEIAGQDFSEKNLYIRDQTFETVADEVVGGRDAQIHESHRLRDPQLDPATYANNFTKKAKDMGEEYSSSVRQHIVKQWVQSKLDGVISVAEDKKNKGKNNKGVFMVKTLDKMYAVKVAIKPDTQVYEQETVRAEEVKDGLGEERGLFSQIINHQKNWQGLTLGLYPAAPGMTVGQGFDDFKKKLVSEDEILGMFSKVAAALAQFNVRNEKDNFFSMESRLAKKGAGLRSHNDANQDNILMDSKSGQVSFIDNDGVSVDACAYDVERDVESLMLRFTRDIGVQAGLEAKSKDAEVQARHIMDVVIRIIEEIRQQYAAKIKSKRFKKLIEDLCENRSKEINDAFNKEKSEPF